MRVSWRWILLAPVVFAAAVATQTPLLSSADSGPVSPTLVLVTGNGSMSSDLPMVRRLESSGFTVVEVADELLARAVVDGTFGVIVSSTVDPRTIPPWLTGIRMPMLVLEPHLYSRLGLARGGADVAGQTDVISMGGRIRVTTGESTFNVGEPTDDAQLFERLVDGSITGFAYRKGDPGYDGPVAAARMGTFIGYDAPGGLTEAGWEIFDRRIRWLFGGGIGQPTPVDAVDAVSPPAVAAATTAAGKAAPTTVKPAAVPSPTKPQRASVHLPEPAGRVLASTIGAGKNAPTGAVTADKLSDYWGRGKAADIRSADTPRFVVRQEPDGSRLIGTRQTHDRGRNGPGLNYNVSLPGHENHVTANWIVRLDPDFSFGSGRIGGKLGGVGIGVPVMGGNGTRAKLAEGGSVRVTWQLNEDTGKVSFRPYVYHRDQRSLFGDGRTTDIAVPLGRPFLLTVEVDVHAGRVVMSVDGKVFHESSDYRWPKDAGVTRFMHHLYHGGGTNAWGPTRDSGSEFLGALIVAN